MKQPWSCLVPLISAAWFGFPAFAAPPSGGGGSTAKAPAPLIVVDAAGKVVGRFIAPRNVAATVNGALVNVLLQRPSASTRPEAEPAPQRIALFFASSDCSGTPRQELNSDVMGSAVVVASSNGTKSIYTSSGAPETFTNNSILAIETDGSSSCGPGFTDPITGQPSVFTMPGVTVTPASSLGTPPFTIQ